MKARSPHPFRALLLVLALLVGSPIAGSADVIGDIVAPWGEFMKAIGLKSDRELPKAVGLLALPLPEGQYMCVGTTPVKRVVPQAPSFALEGASLVENGGPMLGSGAPGWMLGSRDRTVVIALLGGGMGRTVTVRTVPGVTRDSARTYSLPPASSNSGIGYASSIGRLDESRWKPTVVPNKPGIVLRLGYPGAENQFLQTEGGPTRVEALADQGRGMWRLGTLKLRNRWKPDATETLHLVPFQLNGLYTTTTTSGLVYKVSMADRKDAGGMQLGMAGGGAFSMGFGRWANPLKSADPMGVSVANELEVGTYWLLESVGEYFRVRSLANPFLYLHVETGKLAAGGVEPGWWSAMWTAEFVPFGS